MYAEKGDPEQARLWQERLAEYATTERTESDPQLREALEEAAAAIDRARERQAEIAREEERAAPQGESSRESAAGDQP
jgi:hypothetical protein